jgi:TonB-dependent starch-binding outer membrane protein SusC
VRYTLRVQILAALLWPGLGAAPLTGQATVSGVVVEAGTNHPVPDVLVVLDTARRVTTADGRFRFTSVTAGSRTLRVSHLAFAERLDTLAVGDGDHVELQIPIATEAIQLAPLTVEVRSQHLMAAGFYERAARGIGIHITRQQLQATKATHLGDFLARIPGVGRTMVNGETTRIEMRGGKSISMRCDTQYFVDGAALAGGSVALDELTPHNIEGIEIYRGASETPIQFDFGRTSCGAIVIWTRHH